MPNPVNARRQEQWDVCELCGRLFPISQLTWQKGVRKCPRDVDDLEVERRPATIAQLLAGPSGESEGVDYRNVDEAFLDDAQEFDV